MPQFELEPPISYYGNYGDNIVTGSMLPNGHRGYVGSYVSGNFMFRSAKSWDEYTDLYGAREAGSFSRNIKFFSREIIYDSLIPDIFEIYKFNGGKFVFSQYDASTFPNILSRKIIKFIFGTFNSNVTASNSASISDNKWFGSFPFMNEYSFSKRILSIDKLPFNTPTYIQDSTSSAILYNPVTASIFQGNLYYLDIYRQRNRSLTVEQLPDICYDKEGNVDTFDNFSPTAQGEGELTIKALFKIIFGSKIVHNTRIPVPISNPIEFDCFQPQIRGWKYGLANAFQIKSNVIFRNGKFGQVRDMLEQRQYTKHYIKETGTIDSPINISFVSGSEAAFTASNPSLNTRSSAIYDYEYKTGIPWQDV